MRKQCNRNSTWCHASTDNFIDLFAAHLWSFIDTLSRNHVCIPNIQSCHLSTQERINSNRKRWLIILHPNIIYVFGNFSFYVDTDKRNILAGVTGRYSSSCIHHIWQNKRGRHLRKLMGQHRHHHVWHAEAFLLGCVSGLDYLCM